MRIAVDAGCLGISDVRLKAGVYYVALNLLRELSVIDKKNQYILYSFKPVSIEIMKQFSPTWENKVLCSKGWLYFSLPLEFVKRRPDIFLALSQAMPWYHPFRTVGFIHGLDFLPEFHQKRNKKLKKNSEYLIHHSDRIITTSNFLKQNLQQQYDKKNIIVSPLGIDSIFFQSTNVHKIEKQYFLFIGTLKASKNIPNVLKAYSLFLKKTTKKYSFVFIGSNFWLDKDIEKTIKDLKLEKYITFIPFTENEMLPSYYSSAKAFVSPSLYEGFGLPFVEAMASGCPVIGSTAGAIPEVVGDAGILVDPYDVEAIAGAMERIALDSKLRGELREKGLERAKQFSWEKFAKEVLEVINTV